MLTSIRYKVFFTPRKTQSTYASQIEVTEFISIDGIQSIVASIDSTDYSIGVFTFGDIQLKGMNVDGYFNTEEDYRSIFKFSRDLCKVEVHFQNTSGDLIVFKGIINDEATVLDGIAQTIDFRVLSQDSILRNSNVSSGSISDGMTTKAALTVILDVPQITSVLNFNIANINPFIDFTIDNGAAFDNMPSRDAVNEILLATNSIMIIDGSSNIIVRDRDPTLATNPITSLYGPYDIQRRENIISLQDYNTGKQRMFNAVKVNSFEAQSLPLIETFGYRKKEITLAWVTDSNKEQRIAEALLAEFAAPKIEFAVVVPAYIARDTQLLDLFSVNYPLRYRPVAGTFMPIIGITKIGASGYPLPEVHGSFSIPDNIGFKVIEKSEDPSSFEITLKLRQIGKSLSDGVINTPENAIVGFASIGSAVIGVGDTDTWNPSVTGAAKIGATRVA